MPGFDDMPVNCRAPLACLVLVGGVVFSVIRLSSGLALLRYAVEPYSQFGPRTAEMDEEELGAMLGVGVFSLTLGCASIYGGARELRDCWRIVRRRRANSNSETT